MQYFPSQIHGLSYLSSLSEVSLYLHCMDFRSVSLLRYSDILSEAGSFFLPETPGMPRLHYPVSSPAVRLNLFPEFLTVPVCEYQTHILSEPFPFSVTSDSGFHLQLHLQ